jgi:tRNA threonylcarbamoyladenosine biosynthesis protein TsaE
VSAVRSSSAEETERAGAEVAGRLGPGDLVLVSGELGAGKTTFVRGACRALGVSGPVVSPTYTIGRRYEGREGLRVSHLDLYRLADLADEDPGLFEDYLTPDAIAFVEWPAVAIVELPEHTVSVAMRHAGDDERQISVEWARAQ